MSLFISDAMIRALESSGALWPARSMFDGATLGVAVVSRAPVIDPEYSDFSDFYWLDDLLSSPGWREASSTNYARQTFKVEATTEYLALHSENTQVAFPTDMDSTRAEALVFYSAESVILPGGTSDPVVLFVTDNVFQRSEKIIRGGDLLSAQLDTDPAARWLIKWTLDEGDLAVVSEGPIVIMRTAPPFEGAYTQHVWMLPQRVNYIANPSFEGGVTHWQTNGSLTRKFTDETEAPGVTPSAWVGHVTVPFPDPDDVIPLFNPDTRLYMLSAPFFPLPRTQYLSFQMQASGTGVLRVGIRTYRKDLSAATSWGVLPTLVPEEWNLTGGYTHVAGVRNITDIFQAQLLIEVRGFCLEIDNESSFVPPELYLDQVLVEEGPLLDWPYFDGDSLYGANGDFSWYGRTSLADKQGKSYSLWYNNKNAVAGRLFGRLVDDDTLYTSTDQQLDSLTSQWVPTGTVVVPHWDVLLVNDPCELPEDLSGTAADVDVWPDQRGSFQVVSVSSTNTSSVIEVSGEGGYPVYRAHLVRTDDAGVVTRSAVTVSRTSYADSDNSLAARTWRETLYDPAITQTLNLSWALPGAGTLVLYLERGDADSPQMFRPITSRVDDRCAHATGEAYPAKLRPTDQKYIACAYAVGAADNPEWVVS